MGKTGPCSQEVPEEVSGKHESTVTGRALAWAGTKEAGEQAARLARFKSQPLHVPALVSSFRKER